MHPKCVDCDRMKGKDVCPVYSEPDKQHSRIKGCAMRVVAKQEVAGEKFVDPLKASKKSMKKR